MPKNIQLSDERDIPLLQFLWRWKVASTSAIAARFFRKCSLMRAYRRLYDLEKASYIESRCDHRAKNFVWTLSKKGFCAIQSYLPVLKEVGYKSEAIYHDAVVVALHLGEFLQGAPPGVEVFTEQQLRRVDFEFYPSWVSKTDRHRSDGLWKIPLSQNEFRVLALEVELTVKSNTQYELIADFYNRQTQIERVIWLTENETNANRIWRNLSKNNEGSKNFSKHSFLTLTQFQKFGWDAEVILGPDQGCSFRKVLLRNIPATSPQLVSALLHLDLRKSPHKSASCKPSRAAENSL